MPHKHVCGKVLCPRPDDDVPFDRSVDDHDLHLDGHVGHDWCGWQGAVHVGDCDESVT
jgi:hypothetical protein